MGIWCCCQQCWPETPVVTWGHIARQQGTQYIVHSTLATGHGPLRYQSSPCKKWHCLDLFKVQDVLPSGYIAHMSQPPSPVSSHSWLLLNLTCHQWPRRDSLFLIIIWSPIICDYSIGSELTRVICSETFSTRRGVTGPGGGTSEHSSIAEATHGRNKYSFDLMTLSILDIQQWHYITVL